MMCAISMQEWTDLLSVVLWPLVAVIVLIAFRKLIFAAFGKMKSFRIKDIEAEFYKREKELTETEIMPLQDEITSLEERIDGLESQLALQNQQTENHSGNKSDEELLQEVKSLLSEGPYRWRSVNKLAMVSNRNVSSLIPILQQDPAIVTEKNKAGKIIVRLVSR